MGLLYLNRDSTYNTRAELFANNEQGLWLDPSDMTAGKAGWRRNLLGYTGELTNSYWSAVNATVALDGSGPIASAPNAYVLTSTSTTGLLRKAWTLSTANEIRTVSFYAKAGTSGWCAFRFNAFDTSPVAYFNLSTGQVGTVSVLLPANSASIVSVGGGWYRCIVTNLQSSSDLSGNLDFHVTAGDNSLATVGGESIYLTGLQFEAASSPSEYQPITDFSTEFKAAFPTHTLYQDSNGVTPCTAAGDPVGLILDQSRGGLGALGANLITSFDMTAAGWSTVGAGTTKTASTFTTTAAGGVAIGHGQANNPLTNGKVYRYTLSVSCSTSSTFSFRDGGGSLMFSAEVPVSSTPVEINGLANINTTNGLYFRGSAAATYTIHSFTAREVPGNHASQSSSSARPTLAKIPVSGRRNLLTRTEEFDNAAWSKTTATLTAGVSDPDGGNTAWTFTAAGASSVVNQIFNGLSGSLTNSIWIRRRTGTGVVRFYTGAASATQQMQSVITNGWQRLSTATGTASGASDRFGIILETSGDAVDIWRPQLETGSTVTNYQKVVATTDVTESGVGDLWHLVFDGSDDSLVTNSVDFTATDEMTVIAGVRKLSDAAIQCLYELGTSVGGVNGTFGALPSFDNSAGAGAFWWVGTRGTNPSYARTAASFAAPQTCVHTALHDISADQSELRINGTSAVTSVTDQGTGNYSNNPFYIGRRASSSLPFNGHIYQLIVRGKTTPTGKLLEAEKFVSKKTGVNL